LNKQQNQYSVYQQQNQLLQKTKLRDLTNVFNDIKPLYVTTDESLPLEKKARASGSAHKAVTQPRCL
jgi:hypothetical protein